MKRHYFSLLVLAGWLLTAGGAAPAAVSLTAATASELREVLTGNEGVQAGYLYDLNQDGRIDVLDLLAADVYPIKRWVIVPCRSTLIPSLRESSDPGAGARSSPVGRASRPNWAAPPPPESKDEPVRDPLVDQGYNPLAESVPFQLNVEGLTTEIDTGIDPVGDVGLHHYVQAINTTWGPLGEPAVDVGVFDKASGAPIPPRVCLRDLWTRCGGCGGYDGKNLTDPVVLYDHQADRWLLLTYANQKPLTWIALAVSETADPLGSYFLYSIGPLDVSADYIKAGIWLDAYYLSTQIGWCSPVRFWAVEREKVLRGESAQVVMTERQENFSLPADLDGPPPPKGAPGWFVTMMDDQFWPAHGNPGVDRLSLRSLQVDWANWALTRLSEPQIIPTAAFRYISCGDGAQRCCPQRESELKLDSLASTPMYRLQYRNFGAYETLVGNFTVSAAAAPDHRLVPRWYELRKYAFGPGWQLHQEGSFGPPDTSNRFFGSLAMNGSGAMALGYSIAGEEVFTTARYATRQPTDPPGVLRQEVNIHDAAASKRDELRMNWADYSCMSVDPVDDQSFWYVNIYLTRYEMNKQIIHSRIVRIAPPAPK